MSVRTALSDPPLIDRLRPAPRDAGFKLDDQHIWCGSPVRVGDRYHLFASRWPRETGFPEGYRSHSEVVRAVADNPLGPYRFEEVVVGGRGGAWWDGKMCHNPKILPVAGGFVLFYIGSAVGSGLRKVGYAMAPSVEGPWTRCDEPLALTEDANNPAPLLEADGSLLLAFRDERLRLILARAPRVEGPYEILNDDAVPGVKLEDPDLFRYDGRYHIVLEDNVGGLTGRVRHGAHLVSDDGVSWQPHDPVEAYDHDLHYDDGESVRAERRERPELFDATRETKGEGPPTHLVTGVLVDGHAWCRIEPLMPDQAAHPKEPRTK